MARDFKEALEHRRSYYALSDKSPISDKQIEEIIDFAVKHTPSAFNSQSTRVVLLLGKHHTKLWSITKDVLRKIVPTTAFADTEAKINSCFASGYGTVLFYEDQDVIKELQQSFPLYADNFPIWSQQTSAMHQLATWTMLEDAGLGASLQHYNPIIDETTTQEWNIPTTWRLIAQMPFGIPLDTPKPKEFKPLDMRVKIFK